MTEHTLSAEQRQIVDLLNDHRTGNVFITGKAGTGKSFVLREFQRTTNKRIVVSASTGIAALNVSGMTLHRLAGLGTGIPADQHIDMPRVKSNRRWLNAIDTIVIDEISMVSADLLDSVDRNLREIRGRDEPFGGIQLFMFGDIYQLPPVVRSDDQKIYDALGYRSAWFFDAHVWREVPFSTVEMSRVHRQDDPVFKDLLNAVRDGTATDKQVGLLNHVGARDGKTEDALLLGGTNAIVLARNMSKLHALPGHQVVFEARKQKGFGWDSPVEMTIPIKIGAHVMLLTNDREDRWVNGSRAQVISILDDSVQVEMVDSGERHLVGRHTWVPDGTAPENYALAPKFHQLPLKLAWAITSHKSQGLSLPEIEVDFGPHGAFAPGQTYVALSRVTSPGGLYINTPLTMADIMVDKHVARFFRGLH
jgi:ATP-dependent exoDNAse (exonuclease V), alpha subunit - helicase superfamily I member